MNERIDKSNVGVLVSDEVRNDVGSSAFYLRHDYFIASGLEVWTGPGGTGTQLTLDSDFSLGGAAPSSVSAEVGEGVFSTITVLNATYQAGLLYFTYYVVRDRIDAEDVNRGISATLLLLICAETIAENDVVALDASGEAVVASKNDSDLIEVVGVATEAGVDGQQIVVKKRGVMDGFSGLTIGDPCFLDNDGGVTQDPVADVLSGEYRVYLGIAISATEIDLNIQEATQNNVPVLTKALHDTGWVECSDWTNQQLGDTLGEAVAHGLGSHLRELDIKVLLSADGTDAASSETITVSRQSSSAINATYALQVFEVDEDSIIVQTGENGVGYIALSTGVFSALDTEILYYRVIVLRRVERVVRITEALSDEDWHYCGDAGEPALQNSWANIGSGSVPARFKLMNGVVHVQAALSGGTVADPVLLFTLPVGYRSAYYLDFWAEAELSASPGSDSTPHVDVLADGSVRAHHLANNNELIFAFSFPAEG